jgi:endonuclease/exonuclease/phosphatase (EEP) superfamily protein YafD
MAVKIKPTSLQTAFWNARASLLRDKHEIRHFLEEHDIDILLINETWLKPSHRFNIPNYTIHRNDRPTKGGGTAILVKSNIEHCSIHLQPPARVTRQAIESTSILVTTKNYGLVKFTSIYIRPQQAPTRLEYDSLLDTINDTPTIIAGDFNAKHPAWNNYKSTPRGELLLQFTQDTQSVIAAPLTPTMFPVHGRPSIIDFAILRNTNFFPIIRTVDELNSDHKPVLMFLGDPLDPLVTPPNNSRYKVSWEDFGIHLEEHHTLASDLTSTTKIDSAVRDLTASIQEAVKAASTQISPAELHRLDIPKATRLKITEKNRARKIAQILGDEPSVAKFKKLRSSVRKLNREHAQDNWNNKLIELTKGSDPYWKVSKALRRPKCPINPLKGHTKTVYTTEEKLEVFADSLQDQFTPNDIDYNNRPITRHVNSVMDRASAIIHDRIDPPPTPILPTTTQEVEYLIKRLKNRKAPGNDGVSNLTLKKLPEKGVLALTGIINACLESHYFPDDWKLADIILFPKPGKDHTLPENHRPISLLPTMSKILERIINSRLQITIFEKKLIPDEQHGFRAGHATNHQLLRVTEYITDGFNHHTYTVGLFLDIAKAFDKVWVEGLVVKLSEAEIDQPTIRILNSFLTNRSFAVKLYGAKSSIRPAIAGVPQGSVLAPTLYNLYTRDIPIPVDTSADSCILAQYADDTAILSKSIRRNRATELVQRSADQVSAWCDKWRIKINADKSKAVYFARRTEKRKRTIDHLVMNNTKIPWTDSVKYLGLTLDRRLTFFEHICDKKRQANIVLAMLAPMIGHRSKLAYRSKLLLYTAIVRPIMTYACPVWAYAGLKFLNQLQITQNKTLRAITNAPWFIRNSALHSDLNMETLQTHILKLTKQFYSSISNHPNTTISHLLQYDIHAQTEFDRPRKVLLLMPP